jgi:hypothetical protein
MRARIVIMITMAVGEPPLIGVDSPLSGSAHQRPESSTPKQVTRPGDLTPTGGQSIVYVSPCRAIGLDGTSRGASYPHLIAAACGPS